MTGDREYLRATEIAVLTGVSLRTVRRRIADKTIPSTKLGGARLVEKADLDAALSSCPDTLRAPCDDAEECEEESEL
jgi:excisionase family DNA binding protein